MEKNRKDNKQKNRQYLNQLPDHLDNMIVIYKTE